MRRSQWLLSSFFEARRWPLGNREPGPSPRSTTISQPSVIPSLARRPPGCRGRSCVQEHFYGYFFCLRLVRSPSRGSTARVSIPVHPLDVAHVAETNSPTRQQEVVVQNL